MPRGVKEPKPYEFEVVRWVKEKKTIQISAKTKEEARQKLQAEIDSKVGDQPTEQKRSHTKIGYVEQTIWFQSIISCSTDTYAQWLEISE